MNNEPIIKFNAIVLEYYQTKKNPLRLGQFLCNTYNLTDNVLFYETDNVKAIEYYTTKYLEKETNNAI